MIGGKAPSLHRYPMAKYLYGAYERPDNALVLLASRKHIKMLRVNESSANARKDYYLLAKGQAAATALREQVPAGTASSSARRSTFATWPTTARHSPSDRLPPRLRAKGFRPSGAVVSPRRIEPTSSLVLTQEHEGVSKTPTE
ncbi:hypothetical protein [Streptomyces sp. NPDC001480]|uniref:hypothetical protein n=1 Tax=Streptomyces sp. NPDC001480 TaxID=3364577 RepID=UPI003687BEEC